MDKDKEKPGPNQPKTEESKVQEDSPSKSNGDVPIKVFDLKKDNDLSSESSSSTKTNISNIDSAKKQFDPNVVDDSSGSVLFGEAETTRIKKENNTVHNEERPVGTQKESCFDDDIPSSQDAQSSGETEKENEQDFTEESDQEAYVELSKRRSSQDREGNCYCGKDRNLNIAELMCASCYRWYHESCIGYQLGRLVPFMTNYVFMCKNCSPTGLESFRRIQAQFSQMCVTALANLTQVSSKEGINKKFFSKNKEIMPHLVMHWEAITTASRKVTQSWQSAIAKTLHKETGRLFLCDKKEGDPDALYYSLSITDLTQIKPNYEAMMKGGQLKPPELAMFQRGIKRKSADPVTPTTLSSAPKRQKGDSTLPLRLGIGYPSDHPFNKEGFRYFLAEPDSCAPGRQEFDESSDYAKVIPGWLYRVFCPNRVLLAMHDRAPQLRISEDRVTITGEKGYCMARGTHGVTRGTWYYEARIKEVPEGGAVRIGYSQPYANLQAPLGFDKFGYSIRSIYGTKFHESIGKSYCKGGYGIGDVVGFLIHLPEAFPLDGYKVPLVPPSYKDKPLIRIKSHLYYEVKDLPNENFYKFHRTGSYISMFRNGEPKGIAYQNLLDGTYFPAIALYRECVVEFNFGPNFWSPPSGVSFESMNHAAETSTIEQAMADMLFLTENESKLKLDNA